jgi:hypothetical protein
MPEKILLFMLKKVFLCCVITAKMCLTVCYLTTEKLCFGVMLGRKCVWTLCYLKVKCVLTSKSP